MYKRLSKIFIFALILYINCGFSQAKSELQINVNNPLVPSQEYISSEAKTFLKSIYGSDAIFKIKEVDPRLKLTNCKDPLQFSVIGLQDKGATKSLFVKCGDPQWSLYLSALIYIPVEVVAANRNIAKNSLLKESDLKMTQINKLAVNGSYYTAFSEVIDKITKYPIQDNALLTNNQLTLNNIIKHGDIVSMITKSGGLSVEMKGIAMTDAPQGGQVQVKNLSSKKMVFGEVIGPARIQIN